MLGCISNSLEGRWGQGRGGAGIFKTCALSAAYASAEITGSSWEQMGINADELSMAEKAQVPAEHSY